MITIICWIIAIIFVLILIGAIIEDEPGVVGIMLLIAIFVVFSIPETKHKQHPKSIIIERVITDSNITTTKIIKYKDSTITTKTIEKIKNNKYEKNN